MAYNRTTWINGEPPAMNSTNLNNMEDGIYNNDQAVSTKISADDYATVSTGGTIKIEVVGTDCYITTNGDTPGP